MPLEYFIIELFKVNKFKQNLLLSFIIILMIETSQFILKIGVFDVDDIIICTFGMMTFYVICNSIKNIRRKYEGKKIFHLGGVQTSGGGEPRSPVLGGGAGAYHSKKRAGTPLLQRRGNTAFKLY